MYAIFEACGKQYKVKEGDVLDLEKLSEDEGSEVEFDSVLLISGNDEAVKVGTPYVENAKVKGKVEEHGKGDKITVFKYKPKKNYRRKKGHRQPFSRVKIEKIEA